MTNVNNEATLEIFPKDETVVFFGGGFFSSPGRIGTHTFRTCMAFLQSGYEYES